MAAGPMTKSQLINHIAEEVEVPRKTVARMLVQAAMGLSLFGTRTIVTGIRAEVAQTLVGLDLHLDHPTIGHGAPMRARKTMWVGAVRRRGAARGASTPALRRRPGRPPALHAS